MIVPRGLLLKLLDWNESTTDDDFGFPALKISLLYLFSNVPPGILRQILFETPSLELA